MDHGAERAVKLESRLGKDLFASRSPSSDYLYEKEEALGVRHCGAVLAVVRAVA